MNTSYFHLSDTVNNAAILTYKNLFQSLLLSFLLSTHACMLSLQSCLTLSDPMDCSLPGCSVHGILQARILEWAAMPSSRGSFPPRDQTQVSRHCCTAGGLFTTEPPGKPRSTGVDSLSLLHADLLDPGIELGYPALQADSYCWVTREALFCVNYSKVG